MASLFPWHKTCEGGCRTLRQGAHDESNKILLGLTVLFVGAAAYAGGGGGGGGGGGAEPSALALLTMGAATWWAARKR